MTNKSKTKGSGYEREQAKFLSDTYNENFTRVPNSGAYIGGKNNIRTAVLSEGQIRMFKGDLIPPDDWKYFNCECKFYSDFQFHQLFSSGVVPILEKWIDQCMEVADQQDLNIMFMKFNRKGKYVSYPKSLGWETPHSIVYTSLNHGEWIFCGAEEFWVRHRDAVQDVSVNGV